MAKVTVYSKNNCVQCTMSIKLLDREEIEYEVIKMEDVPSAVETVKELGYLQVPVIVTETGHWSGFQPERIKALAA